jgi:hypothetical protein
LALAMLMASLLKAMVLSTPTFKFSCRKSQSKILLEKEVPSKLRESIWLCFLGEEVREEACERGPCIDNADARQIPMKLED